MEELGEVEGMEMVIRRKYEEKTPFSNKGGRRTSFQGRVTEKIVVHQNPALSLHALGRGHSQVPCIQLAGLFPLG